jgi:hypothetical protein
MGISFLGDTDEHGLPGYSKIEKNRKSVKICALYLKVCHGFR